MLVRRYLYIEGAHSFPKLCITLRGHPLDNNFWTKFAQQSKILQMQKANSVEKVRASRKYKTRT